MAETKITNGEKIRAMTNEELAKIIEASPCEICAHKYEKCESGDRCVHGISEYLNQEATE